ncbi:MAG: hypothetical protein KUG78_13475, partial [Kangiellaceae bacterium]|nr:hypothetical protein [Kangiellaceae bacterium]
SFCKDSDLLVVVHLGGQSNYGGQTRNSRQPANAKTKNAPVQSSNSRIYQAVILSIDELGEVFPSKIYQHQQVRWNNASQTVQSTMETRFAQLVLASKPNFNPDKAQLTEGLLQGIKQNGLPWNNELRQLQAKVLLLRTLPSYLAEFPDLSDGQLIESLENWLQPFMTGMTKLSQVSGDVFKQALINLIGWQKQSQLEALMPDALVVASGSRIKLDYRAGDKPVLAVKLQEMFGEQQTPLVGGGKISVLIHLLSPARRPLAITEDLASFWQNGYLDVKKEMKGRYPKHPWPDDPNAAQATRYTKPRSGQ